MKTIEQSGRTDVTIRKIVADGITPIAAFATLRAAHPGVAFLFESAPGAGMSARHSIIGLGCRAEVQAVDGQIRTSIDGETLDHHGSAFDAAREMLRRLLPERETLIEMPFLGAYGAAAFEFSGYLERLPRLERGSDPMPDLHLVVPETLVVFDHFSHSVSIAALGEAAESVASGLVAELAEARISPLQRAARAGPLKARVPELPFSEAVERGREAILAGEAYQVVLSQGWEMEQRGDPFDAYRALRAINHSPYMFFLDLGWGQLFGSSPEVLVSLREHRARVRPLAGTRARSGDPEADRAIAARLRRNPKERAEHVMLVDLGRNDLGRVSEYGSVRVTELLGIESFSHVMHLVSDVVGNVREELDAFDVFGAVFPAGTVSGAPKIRAIELIAELEGRRRGFYAGSVGRFGFDGSLDACITLRSAHAYDGAYHLQAGAGIVAESASDREDQECLSKAAAVVAAISGADV
ncbi:MAG TPA: anthranilate synthase component I family protein [Candidatus Tumulicola sp.]|nr:anthranilate synthase component I family protein [Candidatus Tumulicola sp.]